MDKNNGLQEINNAKEAESIEKNNTFLEKIKKYLNEWHAIRDLSHGSRQDISDIDSSGEWNGCAV